MHDSPDALQVQLKRNLRNSALLCLAGLAMGVALVWQARTPNVRAWGYFALGCWILSAAFLGYSALCYRRLVRQRGTQP